MTPWLDDGDLRLYHGDALETVRQLPDESVDCVVTSPPYWGLRDYGTGSWGGGDPECDHQEVQPQNREGRETPGGRGGTFPTTERAYKDVCGKCGASRNDRQMGLEPTPDLFVAGMVELFREIRRVLAPHGTCWVNLGDSYASGGTGGYSDKSTLAGFTNPETKGRVMNATPISRAAPEGLKPKDLVGIPWRVAFALQQPYYAGRIAAERDRAWLAAIIDGEGTICGMRHTRPNGNVRTGCMVFVTNTSEALLDECDRIWQGSRYSEKLTSEVSRPCWRWELQSAEDRSAITRELYPYLIEKKQQALVAWNLLEIVQAAKKLGRGGENDETKAKRDLLVRILSDLNQRRPVDIPSWLREPPTLHEPGWYLRSDVIWSKKNPMPESVTDRPTKAHEYVFLLTKQPRYWFDSEAVRETGAGRTDLGHMTRYAPARVQSPNAGPWANDGGEKEANGRNVRSVWQIATQPYPEAHFACVDDQTEALTPWGWQRHDALTDGTPIAMYDPATDTCRFSPATFHRYPYDGELVAIEKRDSSQRLTPNHRCYVRRRSGETAVVRADELKPGMDVLTCAPLDVQEIEGVGKRHAALLGWYTAEGSDHHDGYVYIYQSESANPQHVETIRELLSGVGASVKERTRYRTFLGRGGLNVESAEVAFAINGETARWLQACGKQLDPAAMRLPVGEAEALLDALIAGDGHRRADGRACIVQKDKVSIDRMQMLALRLGYRAVVSQRKDGQYVLYLTRGRWLTLRGTNGSHAPIGREHYRGIVWCPNVETGFWLARRNGRPFITGNTFPEELARRCILAGCPERVCRVCGQPSERIVEASYSPHWKGGYIAVKDADDPKVAGGNASGYQKGGERAPRLQKDTNTVGWSDCGHNALECQDCGTVLDSDYNTGYVEDDSLRGMWVDDSAEGSVGTPQEVLREDVREQAHGTEPGDDQGLRDGEGLPDAEASGASDGEPRRLRDGAPAGDGGASRPDADEGRSGASSERGEGRQSGGESGSDAEASARPSPEASSEADHLSALRREDHHVGSCPACNGRLVARAEHLRWRAGRVLDPFMGSGTTAKVARDHQRHAIGIDLNEEYLRLAARRLQQLSLLTGGA